VGQFGYETRVLQGQVMYVTFEEVFILGVVILHTLPHVDHMHSIPLLEQIVLRKVSMDKIYSVVHDIQVAERLHEQRLHQLCVHHHVFVLNLQRVVHDGVVYSKCVIFVKSHFFNILVFIIIFLVFNI